ELFSDLKVSTAAARDVAARLICKKSLCCAQTRFDPKSFAKGRDRWRSLGNKARALKQIASNSRLVDEALLGYASQRKCLPIFSATTEETSEIEHMRPTESAAVVTKMSDAGGKFAGSPRSGTAISIPASREGNRTNRP